MQCEKCQSQNLKRLKSQPLDLGLYRSAVVATLHHFMCLDCGWSFEWREEARYVVADPDARAEILNGVNHVTE
jgi:hypothetical protein